MELGTDRILILVGVWLFYFVVHSVMASLAAKQWVAKHWPAAMPLYRLCFNFVAVVMLIPPLLLIYLWHGPFLWQWTGFGWWLANGLALLAVIGFFWSLKYYDGDEFIGLRQWREREERVEDQEHFHISPLHRHVRHPWYALGLVLIWSRDMDGVFLVSSLLMTLYFLIGYRLEERKLVTYHGEAYRIYQKRVPGLIPMPWKTLSPEEAEKLVSGKF